MSDSLERPEWAIAIRDARAAIGLTQAALALRVHASQGSIADWESGKTRPRLNAIRRLENALQVHLAEIAYHEPLLRKPFVTLPQIPKEITAILNKPTLNKPTFDIRDGTVRIEALLDVAGLDILEAHIKALRVLMEAGGE